jgi:hypothetical protein
MTARTLVSFPAGASSHGGGIRAGAGMPVLDADADFQRARRAHLAARALHWLLPRRARQSHPRALDGIHALAWSTSSLRVIALDAIVGTVEATTDFDAHFRPTTNRIAGRWQRVALAHRRGQPLPPITAIERPDGYYVIDGRHRVSVARAIAQTDIEAWISPSLRTAGHRPSVPSPTAAPSDRDERWPEGDMRAGSITTTTTCT